MSVEYTPQALYPSDQDGRDKYLIDELNKISFAIAQNADDKGYGGVLLDAPDTSFGDITTAWKVLAFDAPALANPLYVDQLPGNNGLKLQKAGVWSVSIGFSLLHDSVNSGRVLEMQVRNVTQGLSPRSTLIGTARNQDVTIFMGTIMVEVSEAAVGDLFQIRLRVSSGNDYDVTSLVTAVFEVDIVD